MSLEHFRPLIMLQLTLLKVESNTFVHCSSTAIHFPLHETKHSSTHIRLNFSPSFQSHPPPFLHPFPPSFQPTHSHSFILSPPSFQPHPPYLFFPLSAPPTPLLHPFSPSLQPHSPLFLHPFPPSFQPHPPSLLHPFPPSFAPHPPPHPHSFTPSRPSFQPHPPTPTPSSLLPLPSSPTHPHSFIPSTPSFQPHPPISVSKIASQCMCPSGPRSKDKVPIWYMNIIQLGVQLLINNKRNYIVPDYHTGG